jgi:hypothetical protein
MRPLRSLTPLRLTPSRLTRASYGLLALVLVGAAPAKLLAKESYLVIIEGLAGDDAHRERFHEWSMAMRQAAIDRDGLSPERVYYLAEDPEAAPEAIYAKSTKENIAKLFETLKTTVRPGDQLYVLLIGHGSYDSEVARFNLPGRDLNASDFDKLLAPFSEQQVVFVNTSSASGGFLPVIAKPNRVVVTATKSGYERNEAQFGKYFVEAYASEDAAADADKNERVSVLEAFDYARLKVESYYEEENLLKTEHAQLDDDGDGLGIGEPGESEGDRASAAYLAGETAAATGLTAEEVASDPELAALVENRQDLEGRVEALKLQKASMPEDLYMQELEKLLLELATVSQRIEEKSKK